MGDTAAQPTPDLAGILARLAVAVESIGTTVPEALAPTDAAAFCGVAPSKWRDMNSRGLCPAAVELGDRCPRWSRTELRAWLLNGAPARSRWMNIRDQAMRRLP